MEKEIFDSPARTFLWLPPARLLPRQLNSSESGSEVGPKARPLPLWFVWLQKADALHGPTVFVSPRFDTMLRI